MADDLIERLKRLADVHVWQRPSITEAADRIRELEAERDDLRSKLDLTLDEDVKMRAKLEDRALTAESRLAEAVVALERIDDETIDWKASQIARQTLSRIKEGSNG